MHSLSRFLWRDLAILKKYIVSLVALIALLYSGNFAFAQNLTDGDTSNDICINLQTSILRFRSNEASTNGEVSLLQDFLIDKGYLSGSPTGFYGRLTVNAVKSYQREIGVSPTGNVGALTKSFIMRETCDDSQPLPVPVVISPGNGVKSFTFYKVSDDKRSCKVAMFVGNVGLVNGMYVYKTGEYATEAECRNALGMISQNNQLFQVWIPELKGGSSLSVGKSATATWTSSANSRADSYSVYLEKIKGNNDSRIYVGTAYEYNQPFNFTVPATTAPGTYALVFNGKGGSGGSSQMFQVVSVGTGGINILSATLDNISSTQINLNLHGSGFKKGANLYLNVCVSGSEWSFSGNSDTETGTGYDKKFFLDCAPVNSYANVYMVGVDGSKSNVVSVFVPATFVAEVPVPAPSVSSSFIEYNSGVINGKAATFSYKINNWRDGLVLDIEPTVNCNDMYIAPLKRWCDDYLFDIGGKATEKYTGVSADPYVKGGALYRITGAGSQIEIKGYVRRDYVETPGVTITPVPDSIDFRFVIRDIKQGGKDIWSKTERVQFKG